MSINKVLLDAVVWLLFEFVFQRFMYWELGPLYGCLRGDRTFKRWGLVGITLRRD